MSFLGWSHARQIAVLGAAVLVAWGTASAQLGSTNSLHEPGVASTEDSGSESSSNDYLAMIDLSPADPGAPGNPAGKGGGGPYDNKGGRANFSRWTFEFGAGFNAPIGNDIPYITWGGNFTVGGGYRFSPRFSVLGEYQFIFDKLPGALVAAGGGTGGNAHIQSITAAPAGITSRPTSQCRSAAIFMATR